MAATHISIRNTKQAKNHERPKKYFKNNEKKLESKTIPYSTNFHNKAQQDKLWSWWDAYESNLCIFIHIRLFIDLITIVYDLCFRESV